MVAGGRGLGTDNPDTLQFKLAGPYVNTAKIGVECVQIFDCVNMAHNTTFEKSVPTSL